MLLLPREGPGDASSISRASQACSTCRKQKRKCDKILPACGLCSRMGRICDYSDSQPAPTADDLAALQVKLMELEDRLNSQNSPPPAGKLNGRDPLWLSGSSKFPSELFLDSDVFMTSEIRIPRPPLDVPVVNDPVPLSLCFRLMLLRQSVLRGVCAYMCGCICGYAC